MAVSRILLAALLFFGLPSLWAPGPEQNRKGNAAFRSGKYDRAAEHYQKAMEILPGDRALSYNAGTALLKQKKYDEALKSLMAGASDSRPAVRNASLYNSGNALFETQKYPEALSAYREAILGNAGDMDAKFNYELAQYRLKKQEQEQKNQQKNQDKQQQKQDQNQNQQNQQQNQDQRQDQNQQNQDQQNQNQQQNPADPREQPQDKEKQNPAQQEPRPASLLSKQEAERLLDALKANEMEMLKARLRSTRKKNVERDW